MFVLDQLKGWQLVGQGTGGEQRIGGHGGSGSRLRAAGEGGQQQGGRGGEETQGLVREGYGHGHFCRQKDSLPCRLASVINRRAAGVVSAGGLAAATLSRLRAFRVSDGVVGTELLTTSAVGGRTWPPRVSRGRVGATTPRGTFASGGSLRPPRVSRGSVGATCADSGAAATAARRRSGNASRREAAYGMISPWMRSALHPIGCAIAPL